MATKQRPVQCVACRQPVPESTERLNYFAQLVFKPEADEVENFLAELRDITEHIEALFTLLTGVDKGILDDTLLSRCHRLGLDLAQEARERVKLADEALELRAKRVAEESAESAQTPARKGG